MNNMIVFGTDIQYAPAKGFVDLLANSGRFQVRTSKVADKEIFTGCDAAFMFLRPGDLWKVTELTRSFLEVAAETEIKRLAWVAPACGETSNLGKDLARTEALVRSSNFDSLVLRHAPLFSDILTHEKELKFRRTLSLPLGSSPLPWLAPSAIAEGLYKWVLGEVNNQPPDVLTGPSQLTGEDLARGLSEALKQNTNGIKFAQRRFQSIDLDRSGEIDPEELFPYLLDLGYSSDEAQIILEEADTDHSGTIDFSEFMEGLGGHLEKILADVPTEVSYFNIPQSTALYDLMTGGMSEKAAQSSLDLLRVLNEQGLPEQPQELTRWLGRSSISLTDWANQYALDLLNVHIIPGRGILTINEGTLEGHSASITRLLTSNDRLLIGRRTLDGKRLELGWADEDLADGEEVSYTPGEGEERVLRLQDGKLVSISVRGLWGGRRLASPLLFQEQPMPRWQVSLFRELGELQIEEVSSLGAADEIVCNCTQTNCGAMQELIEKGFDSLEKITEITQITKICGGCQALVEELLGSSTLSVAELVAKEDLGRGISKFQFRPVDEEVVASQPGQHILVQGRVNKRWVTRAYTLTSPADQTQMYEITVKREEMGVFSRWLCARADSESLFRISSPRGEYFLADEAPVVFFAGGIGVTPAIAMMQTLANRGDGRQFHLDWSASYPEDFVFKSQLEQLTAAHPHLTFTTRSTKTQGRISASEVQSQYPFASGAVAFMCGPQGFMDVMREYLQQAGWPDEAIRQELFSSQLDEEGKAEIQGDR